MMFPKIGDFKEGIKATPSKIKKSSNTDIFKIKKDFNQKKKISEDELRKIANFKVMFRKSILMHLFVFFSVMTMLFIINYLFTPTFLWYLFTLMGWLIIGTTMHGITYILFARGVDSGAKRAVIYHIASYISVITLLIMINILTIPTMYWVFSAIIFWGSGLGIHIAVYFIFLSGTVEIEGVKKSKKEIEIEREVLRMKNEITQRS